MFLLRYYDFMNLLSNFIVQQSQNCSLEHDKHQLLLCFGNRDVANIPFINKFSRTAVEVILARVMFQLLAAISSIIFVSLSLTCNKWDIISNA